MVHQACASQKALYPEGFLLKQEIHQIERIVAALDTHAIEGGAEDSERASITVRQP